MCLPAIFPALAGVAGGATAAGATAGAATAGSALGSVLSIAGTAMSVIGTVAQAQNAKAAAEAQADAIETQKRQTAQLNSVKEQRSRQQFRQLMSQQRAELAARGVSLDSPTAVFLGQTAAREMTFEAQSIRQTGFAQQAELSNSQNQLRAQGRNALLKGGFSAAGGLLSSAPDLWPDLLA